MGHDWPALWAEWMAGWAQRKNPVMPFWAKDWLADTNVKAMSYHVQGVYLNLLLHNWNEGSLPESFPCLSGLLGVKTFHFRTATWEGKLSRHFVHVSEGRISNKRMILEGVRMIRERHRKRTERERTNSGRDAVPIPTPIPSPSSIPPFPPEGGNVDGETNPRTRRKTASTYRAREAARDALVSDALLERARKVIEGAEKAKLEAVAAPEAVVAMAERSKKRREISVRLKK